MFAISIAAPQSISGTLSTLLCTVSLLQAGDLVNLLQSSNNQLLPFASVRASFNLCTDSKTLSPRIKDRDLDSFPGLSVPGTWHLAPG
jgi:hypothetical protein